MFLKQCCNEQVFQINVQLLRRAEFEKNAGTGTRSCFTLRVSALFLNCLCLAVNANQMSEVFEILHTFKC